MDWAEECGVQILIDLHTVPGSQNGYDNGGITGVCKWCKDPGCGRVCADGSGAIGRPLWEKTGAVRNRGSE